MKEARIFKEDKRRKNEPLNEKSFEEFKTKAGPQVLHPVSVVSICCTKYRVVPPSC